MTVKLEEIAAYLGGVDRGGPRHDPEIGDLSYDSRKVSGDALFFCLRGAVDDGHRHAGEAVARGAVALVAEHELALAVPQLLVPDSRAAMNRVAAPFFGNPSASLEMVGVTGTNGKTTTAYMIDAVNRARGRPAGLIGTIEIRLDGVSSDGVRTTPESVDLQRMFGDMSGRGVSSCVMEVTSHGIDQGRIEGIVYDVAVFTNLGQDHLDYHGTFERYSEAKRALFVPERCRLALLNVDDPFGARLAARVEVPVITYALDEPADFTAGDVRLEPSGAEFRIAGRGLDIPVSLRIPARFNVLNAVAAAATAHLLGVPAESISEGLEGLEGVPGRFERVDEGQDFTVVVDYAHTPEGLAGALSAARGLTEGRVIAVFGCGGDRDRSKRPLMGEAAAKHADLVFVTSDNPRSEEPPAIIADIEEGLRSAPPPGGYLTVADRGEAIGQAVRSARPGDVVVIAGKGHETYQEFAGGKVVELDDRRVASAALRSLR